MAREMRTVPYNPDWPRHFEAEAAALRNALGDLVVRVHHVGSTSVHGLSAKPIIDICVEVRSLPELDASDDVLRGLGYVPRGEFGIPGRRYYPKGGEDRTHHLHAFVRGDPQVSRHLVFRDYLRCHPDVAANYARVKAEASSKHPRDAEGYQAYKHAFIQETLTDAEAWAGGCGDSGRDA